MSSFLKFINNSFKFGFYLFWNLPAAWFSGVRIRSCNAATCTTRVPFRWLTQNPFKSTYFASLAMAAEMSTGILALNHIYKRKPSVSMLIVNMEAIYFKKATGTTYFTCVDGEAIKNAIEDAIHHTEGVTARVKSTGTSANGEKIAEFYFTWSFKIRAGNKVDAKTAAN